MADRLRSRSAWRNAVVAELLGAELARLAAAGPPLRVLDLGGGTGGFAVPLAEQGHAVTVVDPSPDSLAALGRRAAEAGVAALVRGVQGDAADLVEVVAPGSVDVVVCHSVLEVVDDPAVALAALTHALRPGGLASIVVANRVAAVQARAAAGRLAEARALLTDPAGRAGAGDPLLRRFSPPELDALVVAAGLTPRLRHGVRVFTDVVPASLLDADPDAVSDVLALERAASSDPAYDAVASQLHVIADRPAAGRDDRSGQ